MVEVRRVTQDVGASRAGKRAKDRLPGASERARTADKLAKVLAASARDAKASGLTDQEIEAELAGYNSERRD